MKAAISVLKALVFYEKLTIKFILQADKNRILFADNFGLGAIQIPLFEIEKTPQPVPTFTKPIIPPVKPVTQPVTLTKNKKSHSLNWIIGILAILVLAFAGYVVYQMGYFNDGLKIVENLFIQQETPKPQLATNDTLQGNADANTLKRQVSQI